MLDRLSAFALAAFVLSAPAVSQAQEGAACGPGALCPAGFACIDGACHVYQPGPPPQAPPPQAPPPSAATAPHGETPPPPPQGAAPPPAQQPVYQGQPQQGQPYQGQPYQGQPYQGQPQQGQPVYQGQPYQGQPQPGQPVYQGQPYGQPAYGQAGYQPAQPRTERRPIMGLVISGAVMFGVGWLVHGAIVSQFAGYSTTSGFSSDWEAFRFTGLVPVLGPWIQLGIKPSGGEDGWDPYLVVDGLLQTAGLAMFIVGLAVQEERTVYARGGEGPSLTVVPQLAPDRVGLTALGTF